MRALQERRVSQRRACVLAACPRATVRYRARKPSDDELAAQLRSLAADEKSRSHGYRKYTWLLRRDFQMVVNHKRVYRIYAGLQLDLPKAENRHVPAVRQCCPPPAVVLNERWSVDFAKDRLVGGRQYRVFDIVEDCTSECLTITADFSLPSARVIGVFDRLVRERGLPRVIRFDNGPEFRSFNMERWAKERGITLHFIDPGRPTQNGKIESFHGRLRAEFLNHRWFHSLAEVQEAAEDWRYTYNHYRPHQTLHYETPARFASAHSLLANLQTMLQSQKSDQKIRVGCDQTRSIEGGRPVAPPPDEQNTPTSKTTSPQLQLA